MPLTRKEHSRFLKVADCMISINFAAHDSIAAAKMPNSIMMSVSPIWHPGKKSIFGKQKMCQRITVLPAYFRAYYFAGEVRDSLRSLEVQSEIVKIIDHYSEQPNRLTPFREAVYAIYESDDAPLKPIDIPFTFEFQALSVVSADVGRLLAAQLTIDEIRAFYSLIDSKTKAASALKKLRSLQELESAAFAAALELPDGAA